MAIAGESSGDRDPEGLYMAKPILPDELWDVNRPAAAGEEAQSQGWTAPGRRPRDLDRHPLGPQDGHPWEDFPCGMGCGSGMTCWRRPRDWQADGTWDVIHKALLGR